MRRAPLLAAALALLAAACVRPNQPTPNGKGARVVAAPAAAGPALSVYDLPSVWRDQRGDSLPLANLAGKVRVVAMVYTSCHATCPLIVGDLKRIEAALPAGRQGDVGFVLVSLDPARDTPGRLAEWAAATRLDPARWTLLNGSDAEVRELAATLGVRYQALAGGEMAHTNAITVLDPAGGIAHQQTGLGDASGETAAAIARLLR